MRGGGFFRGNSDFDKPKNFNFKMLKRIYEYVLTFFFYFLYILSKKKKKKIGCSL